VLQVLLCASQILQVSCLQYSPAKCIIVYITGHRKYNSFKHSTELTLNYTDLPLHNTRLLRRGHQLFTTMYDLSVQSP
jgi:hypothetical protein